MELLPTWYCDSTGELNDLDTEILPKYNVGDSFDCYWAFHENSNIDKDPEDLPNKFGFIWPTI